MQTTTVAVKPEPGPRDDGREFQRIKAREPHTKYQVDADRMQKGMDYAWWATEVRGMKNPKFADYYRAGWRPVAAKDFPELSGLDLKIEPALLELGIVPDVKPDAPIIRDGQMLMIRPKSMSQEARKKMDDEARGQVDNYLRTLRGKSERAVGPQNTRIYRGVDEVPSDHEVEVG